MRSYGKNWIFGPKTEISGPKKSVHFLKFTMFGHARKKLFKEKSCLFPNKHHPKFLKRLIFIWAKATFFFEQHFPVVARTWLIPKSVTFFLGRKSRFLAKKSHFRHTTPILVNDPFVALGEAVHFSPWERFSDFPFRSYSSFRKKKWLDKKWQKRPPRIVPS